VEIYTAGFTKQSAEQFFESLKTAGVKNLLDIRLNNTSQLAAFAKRDDLAYFLREIACINYHHEPRLAPTQELLDAYKKNHGPWDAFAEGFTALLSERRVEETIPRTTFDVSTVLLCSEKSPERCHRRLVVQYFQAKWGNITPIHL
jgi:uncharacterized protein (DUF488 family)